MTSLAPQFHDLLVTLSHELAGGLILAAVVVLVLAYLGSRGSHR